MFVCDVVGLEMEVLSESYSIQNIQNHVISHSSYSNFTHERSPSHCVVLFSITPAEKFSPIKSKKAKICVHIEKKNISSEKLYSWLKKSKYICIHIFWLKLLLWWLKEKKLKELYQKRKYLFLDQENLCRKSPSDEEEKHSQQNREREENFKIKLLLLDSITNISLDEI